MKAILIVEMPEKCIDCPLAYKEGYSIYRCKVSEDQVDPNSIYRDCPLKTLPKREPEYFTSCSNGEEVHDVYFQGWNDCIDKIMEDKNEIDRRR